VTKLLASGREILITILQTGSLWSDRAVLNGYWREVFIEAMEPSDIFAIENAAFETYLRTRPERLTSFMQRISEQVSDALTPRRFPRSRRRVAARPRPREIFAAVRRTNGQRCSHRSARDASGLGEYDRHGTRDRLAQHGTLPSKGYVRDASTGQPLELLDLGSLEALIV
jgi:CRP-like cAMP-binding protein